MSEVIVVKIGGSTLGTHDTALEDIAELQRRGMRPVVVHGGGALITEWLARHNVETRFEGGLRVTDEAALKVVVAVLAGLVNKEIVASLSELGVRAAGLCGADGGLLRGRVLDPKLGFVGEIVSVETALLMSLVDEGVTPVIAPIAIEREGERPTGQLLNINADTAAGAIAAALEARRLVFLTDVAGVRTSNGSVSHRLSSQDAGDLIASGVIEGGMIPKVEACIAASRAGCRTAIADGRGKKALVRIIDGEMIGTSIA